MKSKRYPTPFKKGRVPKMRYVTSLSLAALLIAPILGYAAQPVEASAGTQALTREEVRADLKDWQSAGLEELWSEGEGPDVYSAEYQRRFATYERLRAARAQTAAAAAHPAGSGAD
ncbi:DUF4148 domain-containing protein [Cupriavidus sp. CP313]